MLVLDGDEMNWAETHHEIVRAIIRAEEKEDSPILSQMLDKYGTGGAWELGVNLTNKFEIVYKGTEWGEELDWLDTLEEFIKKELYEDIN